jgi:hypothetical protein
MKKPLRLGKATTRSRKPLPCCHHIAPCRPRVASRRLGRSLSALLAPVELFPLFFSLIVLGIGAAADQSQSTWELLVDAAWVTAWVDVALLGLAVAVVMIFGIVAMLIELLTEVPREIYAAIRERRILRITLSVLIATLVAAVLVALAIVFFAPIVASIAAVAEWLTALVPSWLIAVGRWIGIAISLVSFIAISVVSFVAAGILFIQLIETLILRRPRERCIARWLQAPWNDDESETAAPSSAAHELRPGHIAAALVGAVTGGDNERPVFRGSERRARDVAAERQQFLQNQLRQYSSALPETEIIEIPPTLAEVYERRALSRQSANARLVGLLYQRGEEQSVLFGRVVDAISCFVRSRGAVSSSPDTPPLSAEIVLRKLRWWERWPGEYPWVALVRTKRTVDFVHFLEPLRNWLGIGIRVAQPAGWTPQRNCVHSNEQGTVAGYFGTRDPKVKYALTCAHVLPESCPQYRITRQPRSEASQPDAALLHQHACVDDVRDGARTRFVSERLLRRLWREKSPVRRAGGYSQRVLGYVKHREAAYVAKDGTAEEFPACVVKTRRVRYARGLLPRPFFRRRFSQQGDSGSWVVVDESATDTPSWLGMVVAGGENEDKMESYVLKASALLRYLRCELRNERPLIPYLTGG